MSKPTKPTRERAERAFVIDDEAQAFGAGFIAEATSGEYGEKEDEDELEEDTVARRLLLENSDER